MTTPLDKERLAEIRNQKFSMGAAVVIIELLDTIDALLRVKEAAEDYRDCVEVVCCQDEEGIPCPHRYRLEEALQSLNRGEGEK